MMKFVKGLKWVVAAGCIIAVFSGVSQCRAEEWPEIRSKIEKQYGGFDDKVKDMTIIQEGKMMAGQNEMTSEMKGFQKGDKYRLETKMAIPQKEGAGQKMPAMETTIIYDGKDGWMISPFGGKSKIPADKEARHSTGMDWFDFIPEDANVEGTEEMNGHSCYIVSMKKSATLPYTKMWIDKDELVLVRAEGAMPGGKKVSWVFSDFQKVAGKYKLPYRVEASVDGKTMSIFTVKSMEINQGLGEDLFDADKVKVQEFDMKGLMEQMMKDKEEK